MKDGERSAWLVVGVLLGIGNSGWFLWFLLGISKMTGGWWPLASTDRIVLIVLLGLDVLCMFALCARVLSVTPYRDYQRLQRLFEPPEHNRARNSELLAYNLRQEVERLRTLLRACAL
jgi:hypothetical protein